MKKKHIYIFCKIFENIFLSIIRTMGKIYGFYEGFGFGFLGDWEVDLGL